jgi:hypothetical protein
MWGMKLSFNNRCGPRNIVCAAGESFGTSDDWAVTLGVIRPTTSANATYCKM